MRRAEWRGCSLVVLVVVVGSCKGDKGLGVLFRCKSKLTRSVLDSGG